MELAAFSAKHECDRVVAMHIVGATPVSYVMVCSYAKPSGCNPLSPPPLLIPPDMTYPPPPVHPRSYQGAIRPADTTAEQSYTPDKGTRRMALSDASTVAECYSSMAGAGKHDPPRFHQTAAYQHSDIVTVMTPAQ